MKTDITYYQGRRYTRLTHVRRHEVTTAVVTGTSGTFRVRSHGYRYGRRYGLPDDILTRYAEQSLTRPDSFAWFGDDDMFRTWGYAGIGQSRDSDALERSNYRRILQDMREACPDEDAGDNVISWIDDMRAGHWAVGWVESITVRVLYDGDEDITPDNITGAFAKVAGIAAYLRDDYAIYDESDYSELEYEESYAAFESAWDDAVRNWDEDSQGPLPTEDEQELAWEALTQDETPDWFDDEKITEFLDEKRLADAIAAYGDVPRVGTAIPGQLALIPHPMEG